MELEKRVKEEGSIFLEEDNVLILEIIKLKIISQDLSRKEIKSQ